MTPQVLLVSSRSDPQSVATAAVKFWREGTPVRMEAIGMRAVYNAILSLVRIPSILGPGHRVSTWPEFENIRQNGVERSVLVFAIHVEERQ